MKALHFDRLCEMLRNGCATASASVPPLQAETVSIDTAYIPTLMMLYPQPPRSHLLPTAEAGAQPLVILPALNRFAPPRPPASKSLPSGIRRARANVPLLLASRRARPPPSLSRPPRAPRMRRRSRRARPTTPPASPRPPPGARARARGAAACTDAMSALPSTGA